ncbi:LacI family DNA-binding transcriptional regulator [Rhodoluna limnophila]|uniref:LacI family DNA-binding transcriptional regulator n=1 Tax=Rhodoluna limnophila TaxID=232537 RepID=UPI0011065023|nr:LacI family DNA-binding transcriptional regulator [Rhodoluna limnophila]
MAGIEDVAKLAGVSTATVSRALTGKAHVSEKTRQKVEAAAAELGYVASHSAYTLATGRNRNIGVIMPYVDRWFFSTMLESMESTLIEHGYDLTLYNLSGGKIQREKIFKDFLGRKRVDALILLAVNLSAEELEIVNRQKRPVLGIGGHIAGARSLAMDDFNAGKLATEHLISLGHRKIANLGGYSGSDLEFNQANQRTLGHLDALKDAGISHVPAWRMECDYTIPGAFFRTKQLLGDPRNAPTAIFCNSDEMAIGAIMAVKDLGLQVPQDISIIGIDNHDLSEFFGLSTVNQRVREQAKEATVWLLELLNQADDDARENRSEAVEWPVSLMVRSSTARPAVEA